MKHYSIAILSTILPLFIVLSTALILPVNERAKRANAVANSDLSYEIAYTKIDKKEVLEKFFTKFNSPLKPYVNDFVEVSDKYDIDYKLLPSISCIESSCGKHLIQGSNNPFGWGIYGNNVITFNSYNEAIEVVGKGISENYIKKGYETPEQIAPIYTPPAHRHWLASVNYFVDQIEKIEAEYE